MSQQINLYNPLLRRQQKHFSAHAMVQALGLILAGALLFYGYVWQRTAELEKQAAQGAQLHEVTQARLARLNTELGPRAASRLLEDEVARATQELAARRQVLELMDKGELGNTRGFAEYLRAFSRQTVDGLWITGFQVSAPGDGMTISGRTLQAELVPVFINRLKRETVLAGKTFAMLEMRVPAAETAADGKPAPLPPYLEFNLRHAPQEQAK